MNRRTFAVLLLLVVHLGARTALAQCGQGADCGAPLLAQAPIATPAVVNAPGSEVSARFELLKTANGARVTGLVFDFAGYASITVAGALTQEQLGLSLQLTTAGCGLLTIGSVVGTSAYTARHRAFTAAGYQVRSGPLAWAWVLTLFSVGSYGASIPVGMRAIKTDNLELALGSFGLAVAAGIFEIINWLSVREGAWSRALASASKTYAPPAPSLVLYPVVSTYRDRGTGAQAGVIGLGAIF